MKDLIIPLFLSPPEKRNLPKISSAGSGISLARENGSILLNNENLESLVDELNDCGLPRFHVFDTIGEARAARKFFASEEARLKGVASFSETGMMRDGEGVLMILHRDRPFADRNLEIIDNRLARERRVSGSWSMNAAICASILDAPAGAGRQDLALAVSAKMSALPAELLRSIQIAMELIPGAYNGFLSISPEEIRRDHRLEGIDPARLPDSLIQPFLSRAASKSEMADAFNEAVDATVERLLEAHPELVPDGSGRLEP